MRAELLQDIKATGGEESSSTERYRTLLGELTTSQEQLESHAVLISALFNEVAVPYCLWDLALCLLRHSGLDAPDEVRKLWKSIIYR